jgi:hypothetical protein
MQGGWVGGEREREKGRGIKVWGRKGDGWWVWCVYCVDCCFDHPKTFFAPVEL